MVQLQGRMQHCTNVCQPSEKLSTLNRKLRVYLSLFKREVKRLWWNCFPWTCTNSSWMKTYNNRAIKHLFSTKMLVWSLLTDFDRWKTFSHNNWREGTDQKSIHFPNTFLQRPKGKNDELKARAPQSKHYKQKAKSQFISAKYDQMAIQNKKNHQDTHAKKYNGRNSKPQKKHRLGTVSENINGEGVGEGGS